MGANAQTSVPAFTAGQVLTAAQVTQINTGIPVFASSTERDAAFGGTGEKTLAEGQMAYLEDTNETQYYDGSSWAAIGASPGLVLVSRTTIGSAVSSVTVSGAFSTDYDNYLIKITGGAGSTSADLNLKLGAATSGYLGQFIYGTYGASALAASVGGSNLNFVGSCNTTSIQSDIQINGPFLTEITQIVARYSSTAAAGTVSGILNDTTSYTAFTITTGSGTLTGGNIDVYGYVKA